jgi:hypothetical protein
MTFKFELEMKKEGVKPDLLLLNQKSLEENEQDESGIERKEDDCHIKDKYKKQFKVNYSNVFTYFHFIKGII